MAKIAHFNCPNCRCPLEAEIDGAKMRVKIDRRVTDAMREGFAALDRIFKRVFDPKLWDR